MPRRSREGTSYLFDFGRGAAVDSSGSDSGVHLPHVNVYALHRSFRLGMLDGRGQGYIAAGDHSDGYVGGIRRAAWEYLTSFVLLMD
jgi:hypothetical protein